MTISGFLVSLMGAIVAASPCNCHKFVASAQNLAYSCLAITASDTTPLRQGDFDMAKTPVKKAAAPAPAKKAPAKVVAPAPAKKAAAPAPAKKAAKVVVPAPAKRTLAKKAPAKVVAPAKKVAKAPAKRGR